MIAHIAPLLADINRLVENGRPAPQVRAATWSGWATDPRNSVLLVLVLAVAIGGGRKLLQGLRARRAADRLSDPSATLSEIESAAGHGRAALVELFGLLDPAIDPARRHAAGRALARLWAADDLIVEEEKALATRGFEVVWRARRRYPRALRATIPVEVAFGLPFLGDGSGIRPENLEWSCRVAGSRRATIEQFGPWTAGPGRLAFRIEPNDFPGPGPHRLIFQAKARTVGLTSPWELDLPHVPFTFEFDANLDVVALLTLPDDARAAAFSNAVRLAETDPPDPTLFVPFGAELAWLDPPSLVVDRPPCDLAHRLTLEFEGREPRLGAGSVVLARDRLDASGDAAAWFPITLSAPAPGPGIVQPGEYRVRAHLSADPDLGWADPDVRSLWPGAIVTPWATARLVRL